MRLVCRRLGPGEAPDGVEVLPWPSDPKNPRKPRQGPVERLRRSPPEMALLIAASRRADRLQLEARRKARKRHHHGGVDVGPSVRLEAIIDFDGKVIREADVSVDTVRDPAQPQRIIRRAVRADPLLALERAGSITGRGADAAETLRSYLEAMTPALGQSGGMSVHTPPFLRAPISSVSIDACRTTRRAAAALGPLHWEAVLWVCLGGTVSGYAGYRCMRLALAGELVRDGIAKLADHFEGASVCAR